MTKSEYAEPSINSRDVPLMDRATYLPRPTKEAHVYSLPLPLKYLATRRAANDSGPSWSERAAIERKESDERVLKLKQEHVIHRGNYFAWDVEPANDNKAWPLAAALRKDGNEVLLRVAERYKAIHDLASIPAPLKGIEQGLAEIERLSPVQDTKLDDPDARPKGVKKVKSAPVVGDGTMKATPGTLSAGGRFKPATKKWNGDAALIGMIDAKHDLGRLQAKLGPLLETFEDAVLHGASFTEIGMKRGIGQHSPGAGRMVVMLGLEAVQAEMARMK